MAPKTATKVKENFEGVAENTYIDSKDVIWIIAAHFATKLPSMSQNTATLFGH